MKVSSKDALVAWSAIRAELVRSLSEATVTRWFSHLVPEFEGPDGLVLKLQHGSFKYWIEDNYLAQVERAAEVALNRKIRVRVESLESEARPQPPADQTSGNDPRESEKASRGLSGKISDVLEKRYQFENFVVGQANQFAHASAIAAADKPGRLYNPLFIHGNTGLGKTHLMQAIGHRILANNPKARVIYITSEEFTNEFITAVQHGRIAQFRRHFRTAEVLLIDDIQFFASKERSQEEFFHTFNTLFHNQKQIVLTSDSAPTDVHHVEQRLISRFEWGLIAGLHPPDIETRLAILRSKASQIGLKVSDQVLMFIAEHIKSNIRRLEGALTRVAAWSTLHDRSISPHQLRELLKDFIDNEAAKVVTVDLIQKRVAEGFDIRMVDMTSKRRPASIALPRQVAMYLSRELTQKSLKEIGEAFGGRDHGTVIHAHKTIREKMETDPQLRRMIESLTHKLTSEG